MYGSNKRKSGLGMFAKGLVVSRIGNMEDNEMDEMSEDAFEPDMQEVGDFVGKLLMSVPVLHMLHLQTDSYAKHMALGDLYKSLPDDIDAVVEEFQGKYEIISSYNTYAEYTANPLTFVDNIARTVREYRGSMGPCSSIQSGIDIIETSIKQCLYKIKNLK